MVTMITMSFMLITMVTMSLRWEEEEGMREAVRRVASSASNGSENSNFDCTDFRSQERPARRILARSRSEAGASLGECDFNESHRKFSESFNENSFRQNSADFDAEGWRSRGGVGSGPNSHGSGAQKEGRGGRGGVGAGPEPMPTVVDGATDVCWGRLEQQQAACMVPHLPNEECALQPADMVSNLFAKGPDSLCSPFPKMISNCILGNPSNIFMSTQWRPQCTAPAPILPLPSPQILSSLVSFPNPHAVGSQAMSNHPLQ